MTNHLTYPESKSVKWLTAVFLALSCFAFSLSPVPADARQPLPTQIEEVVSSKGEKNDSVYNYSFVLHTRSFYSPLRSTVYEKNLLATHQSKTKVLFESLSEKQHSFLLPDRFQYLKMIPQSSDEKFSPSELA